MKRSKSRGGPGQNNCCHQFLEPALAPQTPPSRLYITPTPPFNAPVLMQWCPTNHNTLRLDPTTVGQLLRNSQCAHVARMLVWARNACKRFSATGTKVSFLPPAIHFLLLLLLYCDNRASAFNWAVQQKMSINWVSMSFEQIAIWKSVLITLDNLLGSKTCRVLMVFPTPCNTAVPPSPADSKFKPQMPRWHCRSKKSPKLRTSGCWTLLPAICLPILELPSPSSSSRDLVE